MWVKNGNENDIEISILKFRERSDEMDFLLMLFCPVYILFW